MPTSDVVRHRKLGAVDLLLVLENFIWYEGATKKWHGRGKSGVAKHERAGWNVGADCLAQVFWGVLDDSCRHFSNTISPEAAWSRYMDPESIRLPGTRLDHMSENWYATSRWWMCQSQDSVLEEERRKQQGISHWDLLVITKVDDNLLQDICHMSPKINPRTVITCFS